MLSRSAMIGEQVLPLPPAKPPKYKRALWDARRKKLRGIAPARTLSARALEQTLEEFPRRRIVHGVMREPSRWLFGVGLAAAPRSEVRHGCAQRRLVADEVASAAPIDDVDVAVHLVYAGRGLGRVARSIAAQPVQSRVRQAPSERMFETIPG